MSRKRAAYIADIIIFAVMLFLDQVSKQLIRSNLKEHESIKLIDGVFEIYHFENTGAVWGVLKGQTVFFLIITVIISAGCIYVLYKLPADRKYLYLHPALALVLSGAAGNLADRVVKRSVTDFLYFSLINFPVFNVADICVVIGVFVLMILFMFIYKDEDLEFLKINRSEKTPD